MRRNTDSWSPSLFTITMVASLKLNAHTSDTAQLTGIYTSFLFALERLNGKKGLRPSLKALCLIFLGKEKGDD